MRRRIRVSRAGLAFVLLISLALGACSAQAVPVPEEVIVEAEGRPAVEEPAVPEQPGREPAEPGEVENPPDEPRPEEPRPPEQPVPREERGWFARNWPWVVGGAVVLLFLMGMAGGGSGAGAAAPTATVTPTQIGGKPANAEQLQQEAREKNPPKKCQQGGRYVKKRLSEVSLKHATIEALTLTTSVGGAEHRAERSVSGGQPVNSLNQAVAIHRARDDRRRLQEHVAQAAGALATEINGWLNKQDPHDHLRIEAHFSGSEITYEFTLLRCQSGIWVETAQWEATLSETYREAVGTLAAGRPLRSLSGKVLSGEIERLLTRFVEDM